MSKEDNQREEFAYLAGLIDGEGSIRMQKTSYKNQNPKYMPMVSVVNTNREVVDKVSRFLGNSRVFECKGNGQIKMNKICFKTQKSGLKPLLKQLESLLPFLIIKKKQAELLIKYIKGYNPTKQTAGGNGNYRNEKENLFRESIYQELKKLNSPATTNRKDTRKSEVIV